MHFLVGSGVCNVRRYWEKKKVVDSAQRMTQFGALLGSYLSRDGPFDVLVPSSEGKDSVRVALALRDDDGMHPLTFTWAPFIHAEIGSRNLCWHIHHGFDNVLLRTEGNVHRLMTRASLIRTGDPFKPSSRARPTRLRGSLLSTVSV